MRDFVIKMLATLVIWAIRAGFIWLIQDDTGLPLDFSFGEWFFIVAGVDFLLKSADGVNK